MQVSCPPIGCFVAYLLTCRHNIRLFLRLRLCLLGYGTECGTECETEQAGFFRFAAYNINDSESWHNYAACRQLAYGDYDGASECYLKAIEINPKDSNLQVRAGLAVP